MSKKYVCDVCGKDITDKRYTIQLQRYTGEDVLDNNPTPLEDLCEECFANHRIEFPKVEENET